MVRRCVKEEVVSTFEQDVVVADLGNRDLLDFKVLGLRISSGEENIKGRGMGRGTHGVVPEGSHGGGRHFSGGPIAIPALYIP